MDLKRKLARLGGIGPGGKPGARPSPPPEAPEASAVPPVEVPPPPVETPPEAEPRKELDPRIVALRRMLGDWSERQGAAVARRGPSVAPRPGPLPAEPRTTPHGVVHVAEQLLSPDHHHGRAPLAEALDVEAPLVASLALQPALAGVDFQRMLFLDTETTGLAGGTGTVPFLVGLAW
ncbi:MAG TPA: hypothetical protein VEZ71_23605, partial [Archangium sp.]|nr:hypothetical protein [Archangium sp.]